MKKVLFVCVENAGRSKMAEAFFRKYASDDFLVQSGGTKPVNLVNPTVVKAMNEIGINIKNNVPQSLSNELINDSVVINMGCIEKESCPVLFVKKIIDWEIEDPKGKSIEEVRIIRDQIEVRVKELLENLGN